MRRIPVLLIIILFLASCYQTKVTEEEKQKIYEEKGYNTMSNRLKPEIINIGGPLFSVKDIGIENRIAAIDQEGQFGIIRFDENLQAEFNPVVQNYPAQFGIFKTDPDSRVMWLIAGRGIYTLDMETKSKGHTVVSNDGNAKIMESFIVDKKNKILLTAANGGGASYFSLFDTMNNKKHFDLLNQNISYNGILFPFQNEKVLCMLFKKANDTTTLKWLVSDMYLKTKGENPLTKALNKFQIKVWDETKSIDLNKRIILGYPFGTYNPKFIIKWDEEIKNVDATPIIIQMPDYEEYSYSTQMNISFDGNWMKTILKKPRQGMFDLPEIIIYHLSEIYPQGISMPIYCGFTKDGTDSAFFKHSKFGPCFVEFDVDNPEKLMIYKLNDGLKLLSEELRRAIKNG